MRNKCGDGRCAGVIRCLSGSALLVWTVLGVATSASAATIAFESLAPFQTSYTEAGLTVTAAPGEIILGPGPGLGVNGTRGLIVASGSFEQGGPVTFSGGTFDAQTVQTSIFGLANTLIFTGFSDGTPAATMSFVGTGTASGSTPVTLTFGPNFVNLTSLTVSLPGVNDAAVLDNFTFQFSGGTPVPAPVPDTASSLSLCALALAALTAVRRRTRS